MKKQIKNQRKIKSGLIFNPRINAGLTFKRAVKPEKPQVDVGPGLAAALHCAAQAYSDKETCEKAIRKLYAQVGSRSGHPALFVHAPMMDVLGSTLIYIYIYIHIYIYAYSHTNLSQGVELGPGLPNVVFSF